MSSERLSSRSQSYGPKYKQSSPQQKQSVPGSSYLTYPVSHVVSGLYRRLTEPSSEPSLSQPAKEPMSSSQVFTPPQRTASPFQPPPLTHLSLNHSSNVSNVLLTRSLAEEIRLLIPPRLQLVDSWQLVYSLDKDGSSLSTLYEKCKAFSHRSQRAGYVLVIRDADPKSSGINSSNSHGATRGCGALFGAYLTDPPHPSSHYYGTGECFLWRASILPSTPTLQAGSTNGSNQYNASSSREDGDVGGNTQSMKGGMESTNLPPPPSADTANILGSTTFRGHSMSGANTPDRIRFKAFPYSGVNDYMIFCETGFLSVGGGDGSYGLWLDDSFEKGVSSPCLTFGNEPLSDEGTKFDVLGIELWYIGS